MSTSRPYAAEPAQASRHLLRSAYSLLANTAVTSALGMVFWVAAARLYTTVEVGRDTVLISVMIELSTVCQLNMGNGIARFLPDFGRRSARALGGVYVLTAAVALLVGTVFVLAAPSVSSQLGYLGDEMTLALGFVAALVLWGLFTLQDAALTATRQAPYIPVKNGVFGVLKLIALPLLLAAGAINGVFLAWALPMALLLVPVNLLVFRRAIPSHLANGIRESSIARIGGRRVARFLAQDYLASIFTQATLTVLPLLVIAILGATQSAYFAMPFTIVLAFDTFAYSACSSLVVEGTLQQESLQTLTRVFTRRVLALLMPAAALLALAAPLVMLPFGHPMPNMERARCGCCCVERLPRCDRAVLSRLTSARTRDALGTGRARSARARARRGHPARTHGRDRRCRGRLAWGQCDHLFRRGADACQIPARLLTSIHPSRRSLPNTHPVDDHLGREWCAGARRAGPFPADGKVHQQEVRVLERPRGPSAQVRRSDRLVDRAVENEPDLVRSPFHSIDVETCSQRG